MKIAFFQKLGLSLAIIIVLNLFINFGVFTFYKSPQLDIFCGEAKKQLYETKETCENAGGEWLENDFDARIPRSEPLFEKVRKPVAFCDPSFRCRQEYQDAREIYQRNVFLVLVLAGIVTIIFSFIASAAQAVASGLLFGGVLSILIGTIRYWSAMDDYLRFVVLGVMLIFLIWFGYKKLQD